MITVTITKSPYDHDEDLPWTYEDEDFCYWVWEVFLEGYKSKTIKVPTLWKAISIVDHAGYGYKVHTEPNCS